VTFRTGGGDGIYEHTTELRFNTTSLGSVTITGTEQAFTVDILPEAFNAFLTPDGVMQLSSQQTLNLRSIHPSANLAHYIVASAFSLSLRFNDGSAAGQEIVLTGGQLQQQTETPGGGGGNGCDHCVEVAQVPTAIPTNTLRPSLTPTYTPTSTPTFTPTATLVPYREDFKNMAIILSGDWSIESPSEYGLPPDTDDPCVTLCVGTMRQIGIDIARITGVNRFKDELENRFLIEPFVVNASSPPSIDIQQTITVGDFIVHRDIPDIPNSESCPDLKYGEYPHVVAVIGWGSASATWELLTPIIYDTYQQAIDAGVSDAVPYVVDRGWAGDTPDAPEQSKWRGPRPYNEHPYCTTQQYYFYHMPDDPTATATPTGPILTPSPTQTLPVTPVSTTP